MTDVAGYILKYDPSDEHIVRRLGGAVVAQWASLPKDIQDRLVEQALRVLDREPAVQLKEQIVHFIQGHQPGAA